MITNEPLVRFNDWRSRYDQFINQAFKEKFEWSSFNCAEFAAQAVIAMTGVDLLKNHRGNYFDEVTAMAYLTNLGGYKKILSDALLPQINTGRMVMGDIALVTVPVFGECLGICGGSHIDIMTLRGKGALPLSKASTAFQVGKP